MTGYLTVGLILGLGGLFAALCWGRTRDEGQVVRPVSSIERYLRVLAAVGRAALTVHKAVERLSKAYGVFQTHTLTAFDERFPEGYTPEAARQIERLQDDR